MPKEWTNKRGEGETIKWIRANASYQGDDCLFWPFSRGDGYGSFGFEGKNYRAHRFMCQLVNGPPPTPLHQAAHSCGNGRNGCMTPRHLSWKTNGENQLDRRQHGTTNRSKLTAEDDAKIREMAKTMTQMQIAAVFGVTHSTVQYRLYGGSYRPRRKSLAGT